MKWDKCQNRDSIFNDKELYKCTIWINFIKEANTYNSTMVL